MLDRFFVDLPEAINHVMGTAGSQYYIPADTDFSQAHQTVDEHLWLTIHVGRGGADKVRP